MVAGEVPPRFKDLFALHIPDKWPSTVDAVVDAARDHLARIGPDTILFGHSMNGALALAAAAGTTACRGVIGVAAAQQLPADRGALQVNWETKAEPRRKARAAALVAAYEEASEVKKTELLREYNELRSWYDVDAEREDPYVFSPEVEAWAGGVIASGADVDWPSTFAAVSVPVLLTLGDYDFLVPLSPWLGADLGPNWTIEVFARSGHSPFVEQPDEFVAAVERWLPTL